ncbi:NADP-dependent oxidoreductase [Tsukamurella pulmonis]|uniref:NADP-dependent oxidoreductase n=1 Tax=Tsukamurella pulmonis TaxID=47312 RepID=UPI000E0904AE|nr:NADP-dependent oxidoreductase [Tsukamurella pulmonis]RDH13324.1 NADP-dependent oxidoreductase [Tsukamurella pulmonis]
MRAIGFLIPGGPEVLHEIDVPEPKTPDGNVKIAVRAATVNPSDLALRSGLTFARYSDLPAPYIPGWDAAGTVIEAPGTTWSPGDRVVAITLPVVDGGGAYSEIVVVPAASVGAKPENLPFAEAATIPMNGLTALLALDSAHVTAASTVAVTGAAGAVGGFAVELAAARGATVIADAADRDNELVRSFGANNLVPRGGDFAAQVRELAPGGVDAVIDTALLRDATLGALRDCGTYVGLRVPAAGGGVTAERGIHVEYPIVASAVTDQARLSELVELAGSGRLTARVADVLPAANAAEAHSWLEQGGLRGRLVLEF